MIAPGTGLGESFLTWDGSEYRPRPSEGGHANFAPTESRQIRLLEYLLGRFDHVSVERVCSGIGIPNIYQYLRDVENISETPAIAQQIESAADPTKVIVNAAVAQPNTSRLCRATIDMFTSILASEAGNIALRVMATGGIYLAGGIVLHTLSVLQEPAFMRAFANKGRFSELMNRIPVHAIVTNAALLGAAPIDIVCLGIGVNGHIAFNDPPVADFADPHDVKIVELDDICRQQQVDDDCFPNVAAVPERAVTLTVPRLLRADRLFCVVPGGLKRAAVEKTLRGPVTTDCPASILRQHADCTLYLDAESDPDA